MNNNNDPIKFVKSSEKYSTSFAIALDAVARERKYLARTEGFSKDFTVNFMQNILQNNIAQYFAIKEDTVIGWCDIIPKAYEGMTHVGGLGMGVLKEFRGQGIGKKLLQLTIEHARNINHLEKVELEVYKSNVPGIALYKKAGFFVEGERLKSRKLDGIYDDIIQMGKFL